MMKQLTRLLCILSMVIGFTSIACYETARASSAEELFFQADVCHIHISRDEKKARFRENWLECIKGFQAAFQKDPAGKYAPAAMFRIGKLYNDMYHISFLKNDRENAVKNWRRLIRKYPDSLYVKKAKEELAKVSTSENGSGNSPGQEQKEKKRAVRSTKKTETIPNKVRKEIFVQSKRQYRASRTAPKSRPLSKKVEPGKQIAFPEVTITGLRVWSNPNYTRIVIDADRDTTYTHRLLEKDSTLNKPQRLYVDFNNSKLGLNIQNVIPINDDLLADARAAQNDPNSVRVVVDIKAFKTYKIFSLRNPFRTIIDVWGSGKEKKQTGTKVISAGSIQKKYPLPAANGTIIKPGKGKRTDLAKQLNLGVRRIVIDPGHGGKDVGALGYQKSVYEKNIVLAIAKRLAGMIRSRIRDCEVILTRRTDKFLSLEERTAIANTRNADLFISLHTNASKDRRAFGIETYFLNLAMDNDAILVAQRENAASRKNISDLETILQDLMQNSKINESSRLAGFVQKSIVSTLKKKFNRIKSKGVKQAPFYVLIGADMPAILIETSFISNRREFSRLRSSSYQKELCRGIVEGIVRYIRETNPTAFLRPGRKTG